MVDNVDETQKKELFMMEIVKEGSLDLGKFSAFVNEKRGTSINQMLISI